MCRLPKVASFQASESNTTMVWCSAAVFHAAKGQAEQSEFADWWIKFVKDVFDNSFHLQIEL